MESKGAERSEFEICFNSKDKTAVKDMESTLRKLRLEYLAQPLPVVDWFPQKESDLDQIGKTYERASNELNQEHPGFKDEDYKRRRNRIAEVTLGYRMGQPIERIEYVPDETKLWSYIYNKVRPLHAKHGCKEYLSAVQELENVGLFKSTSIPQLEDISA